MVIVWGSGLYGKCDTVPGLCHVATKFGHLWYIPLIPTGSWIVISQDGNGWRGKEIGLSFKSFAMAWLRTAIVAGIIGGAIGAIIGFGELRKGGSMAMPVVSIALSLLSIAVMIGTYYVPGLGKASHARARDLAEQLGLDESHLLMIDVAYGVMDEAEAEYEMKKIRKRQEQLQEEPYDI